MFDIDVCIIGGGILGCMAARNLCRYKLKVLLIEKENDVCTGITRANTAIIYPGYDNKPGTLKSRLCVKGNRNFPALCNELEVPISKCGSLMVCHGARGAEVLKKKYENGIASGVPNLELITGEEVRTLEPHLAGDLFMGLYAPDTATVQPWEVGIAAYENAVENGCEVRLNSKVVGIEKYESGFQISVSSSTGKQNNFPSDSSASVQLGVSSLKKAEVSETSTSFTSAKAFRARNPVFSQNTDSLSSTDTVITTRAILNCAGLYADRIREMIHPPFVRIYPEKADYFIFDQTAKGFLDHIIFEEPEEKGKGLTLVPTVTGNLLAGPSAQGDCERDDFATSASGLAFLKTRLQELVPELPLSAIIRNFASVRPNPFEMKLTEDLQLVRSDRSIHSFVIDCTENCPTFISLIGIKTPGLTCCDELTKYVVEMLLPQLGNPPLNPDFQPRRTVKKPMKELSLKERNARIQEDSSYGKIICRCEQISEGEIRDAIRRGACTVDGVKRRCGTGMGVCQGSRCRYEIEKMLKQSVR